MKHLIGKTIDHYQILLKIRETGTRILFKAYDTTSKRNLSIEVVKVETFDSLEISELYDLLKIQAKKNSELIQSNIAIAIDSGIFEDFPYFVYNFSPFQPLRRAFNQEFSWQDSARSLVATAQALTYAHEKGIVHGFLSPANIILDENKNPYLFDFGFEQIIQDFVISHLPGSWINNSDYSYCSPEQLIGDTLDARSDIYSMGLILYEWMTGKIAFLEETALATIKKRQELNKRDLDLKDLPQPEIQKIIKKCVSFDPKDRYQSMQELSVLLARGALDLKISPKMVYKPLVTETTKNKYTRSQIWLVILLFLFIVFGAILWSTNIIPTSTRKETNLLSPTNTAQIVQKASATPKPATKVPTPTATADIKPTFAPNKVEYPVLEGTSLPLSLSKISSENSARLSILSRWGIGELNHLAISPNGSLFAVASPTGVFLYTNDFILQKYLDTSSWVCVIEFSADGKKLAIGDRDGLITVFDTTTWEKIEEYSGHKAGILRLAFSPDSSELSSIAADNTLTKWIANGNFISVQIIGVTSLDYSSDGTKIITGGNDFKVNLWNADDLKLVKTITLSSKIVDIAIIKETSILAVGTADRNITLINLDTAEKSRPLVGLQNSLSYLTISPDGSKVVASDIFGGIVAWSKSGTQLWKVPTRFEGFTPLDSPLGFNHSVIFSIDGETVISGLRNGTIRFIKALNGEEIKHYNSLNNDTEKLAISHNSKFVLSQSNNSEIKMWDLQNGKLLYQTTGTIQQGGVFSANDQYFAIAANPETVKVFETVSGSEVYSFNGLQNIQAIQFVQNDRFLVAGNDPIMRMWSMTSGQEIKTIKNFNGIGCTVVYDLKEKPIFIFTKYNYIPNSQEESSFCTFQKVEWMKAISVNETNSYIAYGGNSKLGFSGPGISDNEMDGVNRIIIEKVTINADKTLIAVAFEDNSIGIWDTSTKQKIMQLYGPDKPITDLQFSPDGKFLLSSSLDGTIRVWGIP